MRQASMQHHKRPGNIWLKLKYTDVNFTASNNKQSGSAARRLDEG